jgi:hypothetical protein
MASLDLEARSPNCFSRFYVLKLQGRAIGEFEWRRFNAGIDIRLTKRRRLHLQKSSVYGSDFKLTDSTNGEILASAQRSGYYSSVFDLQLSACNAQLVPAGFGKSGYNVIRDGTVIANTNFIGFCEGSWFVDSLHSLIDTDVILVGLIFHTILRGNTGRYQSGPLLPDELKSLRRT